MPNGVTETRASHARPDFLDGTQACAGKNPEIFYPAPFSDTEPALRICRSCPLAEECLRWALKHRQLHGIWDATTPRQRLKALRRIGVIT